MWNKCRTRVHELMTGWYHDIALFNWNYWPQYANDLLPFLLEGHGCCDCETWNLAVQRSAGLAMYRVERRQRRGELTIEAATNLIETFRLIRAEVYACDPCCDGRRIAYPSLQQLTDIRNVRIPRRLPTAAAQILSEAGCLPSCFSHRRAFFIQGNP